MVGACGGQPYPRGSGREDGEVAFEVPSEEQLHGVADPTAESAAAVRVGGGVCA